MEQTNTPMKLFTTIAAVLISISAFSQDYVEYDNGTFTQNGEELSMEQIYDLTVLHKAGRGNVRKGINFELDYKIPNHRFTNNTVNFLGGAGGIFVGGYMGLAGLLFTTGFVFIEPVPQIGVPMLAVGTSLCVVSYKAFSRIALSPAGCLRKRDENFNKVADKLNDAIKAANQ